MGAFVTLGERAVDVALLREFPEPDGDGWVNDPEDAGRATRWGVSSRAHPEIDLETLTRSKAAGILLADYWRAPGFDRVAERGAPALAVRAFDFGVTAGPAAAVRRLQESLLEAGYGITVDGRVGNATLWGVAAAAKEYPARVVVDLFRSRAAEYLLGVVERRPANRRFLDGWLRRLHDLDGRGWSPAWGPLAP